MKLIVLSAILFTASAVDYRVPLPDYSDSEALRHYAYDVIRTAANGVVDGYNYETTYFSDLDCYNESFQLTTKDFLVSGFRSIIYWQWVTNLRGSW